MKDRRYDQALQEWADAVEELLKPKKSDQDEQLRFDFASVGTLRHPLT